MPIEANFDINAKSFERLKKKYGEEVVNRVTSTINTYAMKVAADARKIITEEGHINSGGLRASINSGLKINKGEVIGEVRAGKKYARFIHEGVKHISDMQLVPIYVSFKTAPSLLQWAIRKSVIVRKTKTGLLRKGTWAKREGQEWVIAKSGKPINIVSGGLKIKIEPTRYFSIPFQKHLKDFESDIRKAVSED